MNSKLEERLDSLKSEYENGQKMLADIDAKRKNISDTLLRIEGAMTILKELVEEEGKEKTTNGAANMPAAERSGSVAVS
jgi:hypothetical protein